MVYIVTNGGLAMRWTLGERCVLGRGEIEIRT